MKTLLLSLVLVIGVSMGVNAQVQSSTKAKPQTTTQTTTTTTTTTQPQAQATPPAQSKMMIKNTELLKPIQDNLAVQFKGWTPMQSYRIDTKGVISYEVVVKKEANEMRLFYDKDGKYLREEPVASMKPATKKEVTPAKPAGKPK